jgi:hypothetical protein
MRPKGRRAIHNGTRSRLISNDGSLFLWYADGVFQGRTRRLVGGDNQAASREHMRSWGTSTQPATQRSRALKPPTASSVTPITKPCCNASQQRFTPRSPVAANATSSTRASTRGPTTTDHPALARIGLRRTEQGGALNWARRGLGGDARAAAEKALECATCHANQDRHQTLFGRDCSECHSTETWAVAAFRHPSPRSTDCPQCHRGPPSHYMEHSR